MNAFDQAKDRLWAIFNASVAYRDPADHRTLTVGGKNLSNARFGTSRSAIPAFDAIRQYLQIKSRV